MADDENKSQEGESTVENRGESTETHTEKSSEDMVSSITQAIAASMEKFGAKLTDSLSQSLGYEEYDYEEYDDESQVEIEEVSESPEPPAKKHKGAFEALESILAQCPSTKDDSPNPGAPGQVLNGIMAQGPPNDPAKTGDPECRVKIVDNDNKVRGEAIIHALQQELVEEGMGARVDEDIAELLGSLFRTGFPEEKLKDKMNSYLRPENVDRLVPVKVNPVIWDGLGAQNRSQDLKMQKVHSPLIKALIAATEAAGGLKKQVQSLPELDVILKKLFDSIIFMVAASKELNLRRRELLKPAINKEYGHLCSSNVPITDELFGADLSQQVKDIAELNKVSQQLRVNRGRGAGNFRGRGRFPRRGSFLGQGASGSGRGRGGFRGRGYQRRGRGPRGQATQ